MLSAPTVPRMTFRVPVSSILVTLELAWGRGRADSIVLHEIPAELRMRARSNVGLDRVDHIRRLYAMRPASSEYRLFVVLDALFGFERAVYKLRRGSK